MKDQKEGSESKAIEDKEEMLRLFDAKLQENVQAFKSEWMKELQGSNTSKDSNDVDKIAALESSLEYFKGELDAIERRLKEELGSQLNRKSEEEVN